MKRREWLALTAATAAGAMAASRLEPARVRTRKAGKVEIVFDSPGAAPNGLQATREGLWIIDQGAGNKAYLVTYEGGKVLRSFETETDKSSGITCRRRHALDRLHIQPGDRSLPGGDGQDYRASLHSGCGRDLQDVRRSSRARKSAGEVQAEAGGAGAPAGQVGGFQAGEVLGSKALGTGAHGQEWRNGKLWFAVPPSREVYRVDPKTWTVEVEVSNRRQPAARNRLGRQVSLGDGFEPGTPSSSTIRKPERSSRRFSSPTAIRCRTA